MPDDQSSPSPLRQQIGDFTPKIVEITEDVLFGDVWERPELSPRDRSLATVAALVMGGNTEQLEAHLRIGRDNGLTEVELKEVLVHMAFYAGWPKALSAISVAQRVLAG